MFHFSQFSMAELTSCGIALRKLGKQASNMEDVSQQIANYLYTNFVDITTNEKACALVRLFKTHDFEQLEAPLQRTVQENFPDATFTMTMKCLALLGTTGVLSEWNDRKQSNGHRAIPLPSHEFVGNIPMVAQLISQLGMDLGLVIQPDSQNILDHVEKNFNVFHIAEAEGSQYIPAQEDFVKPFGIRSVLGVGGLLPSGNLFVVLMFSREFIPRETAELFRPLVLNIKLALLPFDGGVIFSPEEPAEI